MGRPEGSKNKPKANGCGHCRQGPEDTKMDPDGGRFGQQQSIESWKEGLRGGR